MSMRSRISNALLRMGAQHLCTPTLAEVVLLGRAAMGEHGARGAMTDAPDEARPSAEDQRLWFCVCCKVALGGLFSFVKGRVDKAAIERRCGNQLP